MFGRIAKINKNLYTAILDGIIVNNKIQYIDYNSCSNTCPFKDKKNKTACLSCDKLNLSVEEGLDYKDKCLVFSKDLEDFNLDKEYIKLSKSQILQYISLYYIPSDSNGRTDYILEQDIADLIKRSKKTVRRNMELFKNLGLIDYAMEYKGIYKIDIKEYKEAFTQKIGTINIPFEFFKKLLNLNVDEIRSSLMLFKIDSETKGALLGKKAYRINYKIEAVVGFNKIKRIFAKGKNYKKYITETLSKLKGVFIFNDITNTFPNIRYSISTKHNPFLQDSAKNIMDKLIDNMNTYYKQFESETRTKINPSDKMKLIDEVILLSDIYGEKSLINVLNNFVYNLNTFPINQSFNIISYLRHNLRVQYCITKGIDLSLLTK